MSGAVLLVVDDDSVVRLSIERTARKKGLSRRLEFATNGREALERLKTLVVEDGSRAVTLLLDINMPEMDGFETLDAIESTPGFAGVPVFMLSSSDMPDDIRRAYRSGATGYIVKGTTMASVEDTLQFIEEFIGRVRLLPLSAYAAA